MKQSFLRLRYYLEIISLPIFIVLIIHLGGHGLMSFLEEGHDHSLHSEEAHEAEGHDAHFDIHELVESVLTVEILGGILLLIFFTWLWHLPALKKWVPCSHTCCKKETAISHSLAIFALCLHFFPEASIRHELLNHALDGKIENLLGAIGFISHFLVDIIIAVALSSYWKTKKGFWISLSSIIFVWILAFFSTKYVTNTIPESATAFISIISAFLLCMFIHKPHGLKKK